VPNLVVIGGGAAGFFGAISAAEQGLDNILILEKGPEVLTKVRISGGGRCNVTHDCLDPRTLTGFYPRGNRSLMGPFNRWKVDMMSNSRRKLTGACFPPPMTPKPSSTH